jgi:hypothetical protein
MRICFEAESAAAHQQFAAARKSAAEELRVARQKAEEARDAACQRAQEEFEAASLLADADLAARVDHAFHMSHGKAAAALNRRALAAPRDPTPPAPSHGADRPPADKAVKDPVAKALVRLIWDARLGEAADGMTVDALVAATGKGRTVVRNRLKMLVGAGTLRREGVQDGPDGEHGDNVWYSLARTD